MDIECAIKKVLDKRKKLNLNDNHGIQKSWGEIIEILGENEERTLDYLERCSKEDLYWISEVFEDITAVLQSKELIKCLRRLDEKYPELEVTYDIDLAESYIED
ncbi:hypothetical protein M3580_12050 [Bacillus safensis]|uniref:hypothetical protein n=1 Tax=Bacillus safensis TaxID=561879 RepID=UPI00203D2758|nr:hypothetical protein [Bacillus safensis]MCM2989958.1 hypothetical protein [Bacillus safensis]